MINKYNRPFSDYVNRSLDVMSHVVRRQAHASKSLWLEVCLTPTMKNAILILYLKYVYYKNDVFKTKNINQ